jgi:excisionase family DNA binding protein
VTTTLLTIDEVAARYSIPKATLRFWRHKGEGPPAAVIGRRLLYREADCEAWIEQQFTANTAGGPR